MPFEALRNDKLVLREFRGYFKDSDDGFYHVRILITVDGFVHLFGSVEEEISTCGLSDFSFKLDSGVSIRQSSEVEV